MGELLSKKTGLKSPAKSFSPPNGCLQYFYSLNGRISTFNFADPIGGHLDNQQ
jgi:hypothetical protein